MPDLKFRSLTSIWRVKGHSIAIIEEDNVEKVRKTPTSYNPPTGWGTAEGGLYSSGYHDGTAMYMNSDGLHSAQGLRTEGFVASSPALSPVWTSTIKAGGLHEVAHNIAGTAPPLIETVAASYTGAYIWRSHIISDANEADMNMVKVKFDVSFTANPVWQHKKPVTGYKLFLSFDDTWLECIYDDALYNNTGGWRIRHKVRGSNGGWYVPGSDHIWLEYRQSLANYYVNSYHLYSRGQVWATSISCNDLTFVADAPANGLYLIGRSAGVSGAAPVGTAEFKPMCQVIVEKAYTVDGFDPLNPLGL